MQNKSLNVSSSQATIPTITTVLISEDEQQKYKQ